MIPSIALFKRFSFTLPANILLACFICTSISISQSWNKQVRLQGDNTAKSVWRYSSYGKIDPVTGILRSQYHTDKQAYSGTPEEIARNYLRRHHQRFGVSESTGELQANIVQESPAGSHVRFQQSYEGIPIYRSDVVVSINKNNQVTFVINNSKQHVQLQNATPSLSANAASSIAQRAINLTGKILFEEEPTLYIVAKENESFLTYRTVITSNTPRGVWEIFVDATTGDVIQKRDIAVYEGRGASAKPPYRGISTTTSLANGTGFVFDPDPLTSSNSNYNSTGLHDNNDASTVQLNVQRKLVQLKDITLNNLTYHLTGPYVTIVDWDTPNIPVVTTTNPDSFRYTRQQSGFEDVNVYYHLDSSQRYIQSLGFLNIQNLSIGADPHGFDNSDNAFYDPASNRLSFGDGGVDDGEDADIILHEYGHAIHYGTVPDWGGDEEGALGEGFGDYWAASYSRSVNPTFSRNFFATWDAGFNGTRGIVWSGRPLNDSTRYPNGGVAQQEVHDAGQVWSAVLMILWDELGKNTMDMLVLQSHFYMGSSGTMRDNAAAILQADQDLFGGAHSAILIDKFVERNFLALPVISHEAVLDLEQIELPFDVMASITDGFYPIDTTSVKVIWGKNGAFTDTATLYRFDGATVYMGAIPTDSLPGQYQYYFVASDTAGNVVTSPFTAPASYYSFYAGPDTVKPRVKHSPLYDQSISLLPPLIRLTANDNIGIDSVRVEYINQRSLEAGAFLLFHTSDSTYENVFPLDTVNCQIGDSISYTITVLDAAIVSNNIILPAEGYYHFRISSGNILLVNDDTTTSAPVSSFSLFKSVLLPTTFTVDTVVWNSLNQKTLEHYHLIILSSGLNVLPLASTTKRQSIVDYITGGGKVWTEGGDVGKFYRKGGAFDGAPGFRRVVLHDSIWINDATTSDLTISTPAHRIFTTPNMLTSPIAFSSHTSTADRDAMKLIPGDTNAKIIGSWTNVPTTGGLIVYTPPLQQSPQTVFFAFSLSSITDTNEAKQLIENTITAFFPRSQLTAISDELNAIPQQFTLEQNFPNPFNPRTIIRYSLTAQSYVTLKIYDILGREIASLVDGVQEAGFKTQAWNAEGLPSGVYLYKLSVNDLRTNETLYLQHKKAVFIK